MQALSCQGFYHFVQYSFIVPTLPRQHCFANIKLNASINKPVLIKHFYIFYLKITRDIYIITIGPI